MVIFRKNITGATELSLARFVMRARRAAGMRGRVTVLVTSSRELRDLNRRFRGKDKATDVLSFPAAPIEGDDNEGDIAISADIATENAARFGHRPSDELKILALHGILHLAGYDHETDNGTMARKEARLRRELRLPDALIERTQKPDARSSSSRNSNDSRRRAKQDAVASDGQALSRAIKVGNNKEALSPEISRTQSLRSAARNGQPTQSSAKRETRSPKHETPTRRRS